MDHWITKTLHVLSLLVSVFSQDVFNTMPPPVNTKFSCRGRDTGFYADVETNCRVYHTCDDHGNKFTYYCPAETAFRQEALVCDHAHLVDCARGRRVTNLGHDDEESHEELTGERSGSDEAASRPNRTSSNGESSLGEAVTTGGRSSDVFRPSNSNPAYTRSFRITPEPPSQFSTPKYFERKPTFVLSSSVFLRNRVSYQKPLPVSQNNGAVTRGSKNIDKPSDHQIRTADRKGDEGEFFSVSSSPMASATTFRPFGADFKVNGNFQNAPKFRSPSLENGEDKPGGSFGRFASATSATTFKPPRMVDFKVKGNSPEVSRNTQSPSGLQLRHSDTEEGSMDRFSASTFSSPTSTTTFGSPGVGFKVKGPTGDLPGFEKPKFEYEDRERSYGNTGSGMRYDDEGTKERKTGNAGQLEDKRRNDERAVFAVNFGAERFDKHTGMPKTAGNERSSFFVGGSNFPYSETLRSMQARNEQQPNSPPAKTSGSATTSAPAATAGTEFPVHAFAGSLSPLVPNELEDDPYYPKRSTTTEVYYKLSDRDKEGNKPFRFSTGRPWPGRLDFEIPEVLPDLNTLDDLVDRRKLFYIPRVKAT